MAAPDIARNRSAQRTLQRVLRSTLVSPLILSLLLSGAILLVGQFREVFIAMAEAADPWRLPVGFLCMAALSTSLFFGYLSSWVVMRQGGIGFGSRLMYRNRGEIDIDRRIVAVRDVIACICALLPLLAVAVACWFAAGDTRERIVTFEGAMKLLGGDGHGLPARVDEVPDRLRVIAVAWLVASFAVVGALLAYGRLELGERWNIRRRMRMRTRMPPLLRWLAWAMLCVPFALQNWAPAWHDSIFTGIGPVATLGLSLTMLSVFLFWAGEQSLRRGFPFLLAFALVVFGLGLLKFLRDDAPETASEASQPAGAQQAADVAATPAEVNRKQLVADFEAWLRTRADAKAFVDNKKPYPAFIIAAQGGGIYAAGSAAHFLARMQDACANFAQHVFAISAVSGGAIGSTLFHALPNEQLPRVGCGSDAAGQAPRGAQIAQVIRDDHLSGTVAATIPDISWKLVQIFWHEVVGGLARLVAAKHVPVLPDARGRAEALECSFTRSFERAAKPGESRSISCSGDARLERSYAAHWDRMAPPAAPALVLNTTRAETGDRVAFAPFKLSGVGDGTLYSFSELKGTEEKPRLVEAAVASARFPAMMPAKIVYARAAGQFQPWWNFVDGGYADASGATTALEIYQALRLRMDEVQAAAGTKVDLRLMILTDAPAQSGVQKSGEGLLHAISPVTTLFSVRSQMARRAVIRAEDEILRPHDPAQQRRQQVRTPAGNQRYVCGDREWDVRLVVLDEKGFSLALGWLMSETTGELVRRLVGTPRMLAPLREKAAPAGPLDPAAIRARRAAEILYDNSCTMHSITELLSAR